MELIKLSGSHWWWKQLDGLSLKQPAKLSVALEYGMEIVSSVLK